MLDSMSRVNAQTTLNLRATVVQISTDGDVNRDKTVYTTASHTRKNHSTVECVLLNTKALNGLMTINNKNTCVKNIKR